MITALIIFLSFLSITNVKAQDSFPIGTIKNLELNYTSPRGVAKATKIDLKEFGTYENIELNIDNYSGLLIFTLEQSTFQMDISMFGVTDAESIILDNLNFFNNGLLTKLSFKNLKTKQGVGLTRIKEVSLKCQAQIEGATNLMKSCLFSTLFSMKNLYIKSTKKKKDIILDYMNLQINNGVFFGTLSGNISKNVRVRLWGKITYDEVLKEVKIKLTKAKAGLFSVKGSIFKELRKLKSPNIEVKQPFIYIRTI